MNSEERWYGVNIVAMRLSYDPRTLRDLLSTGKIKGVQPNGLGTKWFISETAIQEYLGRNKTSGSQESIEPEDTAQPSQTESPAQPTLGQVDVGVSEQDPEKQYQHVLVNNPGEWVTAHEELFGTPPNIPDWMEQLLAEDGPRVGEPISNQIKFLMPGPQTWLNYMKPSQRLMFKGLVEWLGIYWNDYAASMLQHLRGVKTEASQQDLRRMYLMSE